MNRRLLTLALVVIVTFARPTPASADFWAWLEQWSGPGPWKGYTALWTACSQDREWKPSPIGLTDRSHQNLFASARAFKRHAPGSFTSVSERLLLKRLLANPELQSRRILLAASAGLTVESLNSLTSREQEQNSIIGKLSPELRNQWLPESDVRALYAEEASEHGPGHNDRQLTCYFVDFGVFNATDNTTPADPTVGFPRVRAYVLDAGPSARLHDGVDIGGGFGVVTLTGDGFRETRGSLTPLRIVVRPLLLAVPEHERREWMGVLSIFWKETYIYGQLSGADFGVSNPYKVNGELVRSFGLNVDLGSLSYLFR